MFTGRCKCLEKIKNGKATCHKIDDFRMLLFFRCDKGYKLKGLYVVVCIDGKYQQSLPTCG